MKIMKYSLILLVIIALCSCASSRNTKTESKIDYSENFNALSSQMDSLKLNILLNRQETKERFSNIKLENRITYMSKPDSTGKQYPTAISETKSEQNDKENTTINTELKATIEELSKRIDILQDSIQAKIATKEKVVEVSWWDRYKSDVTLIVVIMVAIIWFIHKKN